MPLIKKIDVKNYFASRNRHGIHLYKHASQPDATGFSGETSARASLDTGNVVDKAVDQPSPHGLQIMPPTAGPDASHVATLADSKSAQA
jgi:hypothetical protein